MRGGLVGRGAGRVWLTGDFNAEGTEDAESAEKMRLGRTVRLSGQAGGPASTQGTADRD